MDPAKRESISPPHFAGIGILWSGWRTTYHVVNDLVRVIGHVQRILAGAKRYNGPVQVGT